MPSARPLPTVIGPTENALRALLARVLSSTPISSYPAWVVLNAASTGEPAWRDEAANALRADLAEIDRVGAELRASGLVDEVGIPTTTGTAELAAARATVAATTLRVVEGIDETDLETAGRVLDAVRQNAEELLSA